MAVTKRLRYEIFRRDNHACRYCGQTAPDVRITVDHVTPQALGGTDEPGNLVTACVDCNAGKTSSNPDSVHVADVSEAALRWAEAMKTAMAQRAQNIREQETYCQAFLSAWQECKYPNGSHIPLPDGWWKSLTYWYGMGVPIELLRDAIRKAGAKKTRGPHSEFRYMAGVVWRVVEDVQATVQQASTPPVDAQAARSHHCRSEGACDNPSGSWMDWPDDSEWPVCKTCGERCEYHHGWLEGYAKGSFRGYEQPELCPEDSWAVVVGTQLSHVVDLRAIAEYEGWPFDGWSYEVDASEPSAAG